jgi:hypothetical protein
LPDGGPILTLSAVSDAPSPGVERALDDPVSPELEGEIVAAYRAGLTVKELTRIYRVDPRRIDALVVSAQVHRERRRWLHVVRGS